MENAFGFLELIGFFTVGLWFIFGFFSFLDEYLLGLKGQSRFLSVMAVATNIVLVCLFFISTRKFIEFVIGLGIVAFFCGIMLRTIGFDMIVNGREDGHGMRKFGAALAWIGLFWTIFTVLLGFARR